MAERIKRCLSEEAEEDEDGGRKRRVPSEPCGICCNEFNLAKNFPVEMPCCHRLFCRVCVRQQFLSNPVPKCLECAKEFGQVDARRMACKSWIKGPEYTAHRRNMLYQAQKDVQDDITRAAVERQRQQSMLEAQYQAQRQRVSDLTRQLKEARRCLETLGDVVREGKHMFQVDSNRIPNMVEMAQLLLETKTQEELTKAVNVVITTNRVQATTEEVQKITPAFPCPQPGCHGLVTNRLRTCTMCGKGCCIRCREALADDEICRDHDEHGHVAHEEDGHAAADEPVSEGHRVHECNPATLASIEAIKANSKPCPKCHTQIERSMGCADMYCTRCGQFFNYRTGLPISGVVHNPEYQAQQELRASSNTNEAAHVGPVPIPAVECFSGSHATRQIFTDVAWRLHERQTWFEEYPVVNTADPFLKTKCDLITGKISEEKFAEQLARIDLANDRRIEWGLLIRSLYESLLDVVVGITPTTVPDCLTRIEELCAIFKTSAERISKAYDVHEPMCVTNMLSICEALMLNYKASPAVAPAAAAASAVFTPAPAAASAVFTPAPAAASAVFTPAPAAASAAAVAYAAFASAAAAAPTAAAPTAAAIRGHRAVPSITMDYGNYESPAMTDEQFEAFLARL